MVGSARALGVARGFEESDLSTGLIVARNDRQAEKIPEEIAFYMGDTGPSVHYIPDTETLPYDHESPHPGLISERSTGLYELNRAVQRGERVLLVASIGTLMRRIASSQHWLRGYVEARAGESCALDGLCEQLRRLGYQQRRSVEEFGEYAVRPQGVVDVYPVGPCGPVRLNITADRLDTIRALNVRTQRSGPYPGTEVVFLPGREMPVDEDAVLRFRSGWRSRFDVTMRDENYRSVSEGEFPNGIEYYLPLFTETASLLDYLPGDGCVFMLDDARDEARSYWEMIRARFEDQSRMGDRRLLTPEELWISPQGLEDAFSKRRLVTISSAGVRGSAGEIDFGCRAHGMVRQENLTAAIQALRPWFEKARRILFVVRSDVRRQHIEVLCKMLRQNCRRCGAWQEFLTSDASVGVCLGGVEEGFYDTAHGLLVLSEREIFGQPIFQKEAEDNEDEAWIGDEALLGLSPGDPITHIECGVGRFSAVEPIAVGGVKQDFLSISYAEASRIFVRPEDLDLVMPYSGVDSEKAPLDSPRSKRWLKGVGEAQQDIRRIATELIEVDRKRRMAPGIAFEEPDNAYERFAQEFPYQETRDQLRAIQDIIEDMTRAVPMDRVICGDVGFGKTEVAMRAAFLAAQSAHQVAVLVPTTLLAQQHYETFKRRFSSFKFRIESLSRLSDPAFEKDVIRGLRNGDIDIVIGTHRLLQQDVKFESLGLIIIDEEHRFGVRQKQRMNRMRGVVDTLSMSATPIPRTLSLGMHGIRDLSLITTPPAKRLSVRTFEMRRGVEAIREAVSREVLRDGQVFFVHNSIETIYEVESELQALFPDLRVVVGHGQMPERELEQIMAGFSRHDYDILLCTTIIETGIDIPNANTIIIDGAENYGLAQLHQLRGRVGRSHHQAYAYLMRRAEHLSESAEKRLAALAKSTRLGQGFTLATHDMEIRGAGELLGSEQSGKIQAIGFQLYMRLLERTIAALKQGESLDSEWALSNVPRLDVPFGGSIPPSLIDDSGMRLYYYKRLVSVEKPEDAEQLAQEMADRFGPLPETTEDAVALAGLRGALRKAGVRRVAVGPEGGFLDFWSYQRVDMARLLELTYREPERFALSEEGDRLDIAPQQWKGQALVDELKSLALRVAR